MLNPIQAASRKQADYAWSKISLVAPEAEQHGSPESGATRCTSLFLFASSLRSLCWEPSLYCLKHPESEPRRPGLHLSQVDMEKPPPSQPQKQLM